MIIQDTEEDAPRPTVQNKHAIYIDDMEDDEADENVREDEDEFSTF